MTPRMPTRVKISAVLSAFLFLTNTSVIAATLDAKTQDLYNSSCVTCHAIGALGAPKTGDKAAWALRLKQDMPTLVSHVKSGFKNMPARGLCDNCTDEDYTALIKFMSQ